jgi:hypothetical protein
MIIYFHWSLVIGNYLLVIDNLIFQKRIYDPAEYVISISNTKQTPLNIIISNYKERKDDKGNSYSV